MRFFEQVVLTVPCNLHFTFVLPEKGNLRSGRKFAATAIGRLDYHRFFHKEYSSWKLWWIRRRRKCDLPGGNIRRERSRYGDDPRFVSASRAAVFGLDLCL